jgi:flagellar motility protein MotE (MotC chaperone)
VTDSGSTASPSIPPSLTSSALRDELRQSNQRRREELDALERERVRLEKLATEIAAARAALGEATGRLDERLKKAEAAKLDQASGAPGSRPRQAGSSAGARPEASAATLALAKTLKGMRTELAASLVSKLERPLAVEVLRSMRPSDAGGVLEKMKPDVAAELFSLMAAAGSSGGAR